MPDVPSDQLSQIPQARSQDVGDAGTATTLHDVVAQHGSVHAKPRESGYHRLASLMEIDGGMIQFRRFSRLQAHSLLMQQAEILHLEEKLQTCAQLDREENLDFDRSVRRLMTGGASSQPTEQWSVIVEVREKLKDYYECLLLSSKIAELPPPRIYNRRILQDWLGRQHGGENFMHEVEDMAYRPSEHHDLVALMSTNFDWLIGWIAEAIATVPAQAELGMVKWRDPTYLTASKVFVVIASTLLPSLAIMILYFIESMVVRIVTSMVLSFLFSTAVAVTTTARPAEIFAATAAFAAVQVVFIGSSDN